MAIGGFISLMIVIPLWANRLSPSLGSRAKGGLLYRPMDTH